jgi:hypothetical protein
MTRVATSFRIAILLLFPATMACPLAAAGPKADPAAIIRSGDVRFTVLTGRLLRLEWDPAGKFEDRPSFVFLHRKLPVPRFTTAHENGWLVIRTDALTLRYKEGSGKFAPENLTVEFRVAGQTARWTPGMPETGNLRGTLRTLDGVKGAADLEPGLLSRDGWTLVDDSARPLFDASDWPWVTPRDGGDRQDWYFFGYGRDYKGQLGDFVKVAGRIPMPPRFAFGLWWSRYWAYTDEELKQLVGEFALHSVPLDVLVVDMDWHLTFNMRWSERVKDQAGQTLGWTGYTWDRNFFPDPPAFLSWCKERGLKTTLNLHPASGIQPHEEQYPAVARAMGIDPTTKKYVPFDITDKTFAQHYMDLVIRPLERQGVDFWWLDWQQWGTTKVPGVTPTWWLNYVFFTAMERRNAERPLLFHRWGGLGNHRYQIGFSGDAISVWESLAFQPFFTATAANVGFGYWSHDMGGHMPGAVSGELYSRWLQFGAFSPIVRTHTTKNPSAERRIWAYPHDDFLVMRDAILLRYSLIPYVYTASREAYDTGVSLCRPMYYEYPEIQEAYTFTGQYFFGNDMFVAPIATPLAADSLVAVKKIWIPPGEWVEWFTGARLRGPAVATRTFTLQEIPVYVRAGAVVPMQPEMLNTGAGRVDPLILTVFDGPSGSARVYEDAGNSLGYQKNECAWTGVSYHRDEQGVATLKISPTKGRYPGITSGRAYAVRIAGVWPPAKIICNGKAIPRAAGVGRTGWRYRGSTSTLEVSLPSFRRSETVTVKILPRAAEPPRSLLDGVPGTLRRLKNVMALINSQWPAEWSPDSLVAAAQTGNRMELEPAQAQEEVRKLQLLLPAVERALPVLEIPDSVRTRAQGHLSTITGVRGDR